MYCSDMYLNSSRWYNCAVNCHLFHTYAFAPFWACPSFFAAFTAFTASICPFAVAPDEMGASFGCHIKWGPVRFPRIPVFIKSPAPSFSRRCLLTRLVSSGPYACLVDGTFCVLKQSCLCGRKGLQHHFLSLAEQLLPGFINRAQLACFVIKNNCESLKQF